jgi:hypothetical protein
VVADVGENNVVQVITYNGSNYKKACCLLTNEYLHIAWQPCLAHTINLMLKTIGEFPDHESVIDSAKLIARWLYNHGKLHTMMKNAIGGNLVRWNATRFGTNYLFLESFLRRKDISCNGWPHLNYSTLDTWIPMLENMHMLVSLACHGGIISKELWNLFNRCTHFSSSQTRKGFQI